MQHFFRCLLAVTVATPADAQFRYSEPPASAYAVSKGVHYGTVDTTTLRMDVYRPTSGGGARPTLVFFTAAPSRANAFYTTWARIAAAQGLVSVLAELRPPPAAAEDFRTLVAHLANRGSAYGIDSAAIAVFGASGNAFNVFPVAQDPRETRVKAAVLYYGGSVVTDLRRDLPVLIVRAGVDRPFVNATIDSLITRALEQNAPITVMNYSGGHHGFETTDDGAITRDVIDQTVTFVKRVTTPAYRAALASRVGYATAAAHVYRGNFSAAAPAYGALVAQESNDPRLRLSYGEALLGDGQFAKACDEFEKLKGKNLGPRDLGLPAARACLQKGDTSAAMAWLTSIPKRFLPARVKDDPVFAALKDRADFTALFDP